MSESKLMSKTYNVWRLLKDFKGVSNVIRAADLFSRAITVCEETAPGIPTIPFVSQRKQKLIKCFAKKRSFPMHFSKPDPTD